MKFIRLLLGATCAATLLAPPVAAEDVLYCPEDLLPAGIVDVPAPSGTATHFQSCGLNLAPGQQDPKVSGLAWIVFDPNTGIVEGTLGPHNRFVVSGFTDLIYVALVLDEYNLDDILSNGLTVEQNLQYFLDGDIGASAFDLTDVNDRANRWLAQLPISDTMVDTENAAMSSSPVDLARMIADLWSRPQFRELFSDGSVTTTGSSTASSSTSTTATTTAQTTSSAASTASASSTTSAAAGDNDRVLASSRATGAVGETAAFEITADKAVLVVHSMDPDEDLAALATVNGRVGDLEPVTVTQEPPETQDTPRWFALGGLIALLVLGFTLQKLRAKK